jgi:hypothetical protein
MLLKTFDGMSTEKIKGMLTHADTYLESLDKDDEVVH